MDTIQKHFVEFFSPGTFLAESNIKPVDSWDVEAAQTNPNDVRCPHGLPHFNCSYCCPKQSFWWPMQHPSVAGHCGKCGAPYAVDLLAGPSIGPSKFIPSCKCWNV